jgi:aspartate/methionine/tyrosine aminotransferase
VKPANPVLSGLGTTVFEVMSRLSEQHGAVNLGQGFPDEGFPIDVLEAAADATLHGWNQYPSMFGIAELRAAVAAHDLRFYGIEADWQTQVMVTTGATEALAACMLGLLEPGDEVVLFQPMYDCYTPMIRRAGAVPRFVDLSPPDWSFTAAQLEKAFSERTKAVVVNDPLNPAAKCFDRGELELIADAVIRHDAYAICDEVYEHLVFDDRVHIPLITLPGMEDRALKIGSAGKTFSLTGWKIGYITGPAEVLGPVAKAHQFLVYTTAPNLQAAVAKGLAKDDAYFGGLATDMERRRDHLVGGLRELGFDVLDCAGTYFCNVDITSTPVRPGDPPAIRVDDVEFCRFLTETVGVTAIPLSAFYDERPLSTVARFCFAKKLETLDAALERLRAYFDGPEPSP